MGVEVTILAAKPNTSDSRVIALCPQSKTKRTSFAVFAKALQNHLARNKYDIIHSTLPFNFADIYQPRGGCYREAMIRNAAAYENKLVSSFKLLTNFTNVRRTTLINAEKRLCQTNNHTIVAALSKYVKEHFKRHYELSDERIVVIPNGVKTGIQPDKNQAQKLRANIHSELNIAQAEKPAIFLFAANNFRLKGLTGIINALALLADRNTLRPIYVVAAGSGNSTKYRSFAEKLGVSEKIAFLGPLRHIQNALSISDAAVLPTYYDPCSRFILEALACKKPVITTEFNGAAEQFENNRHGRIIKSPEDIDALADAIAFYADAANVCKASSAIVEDNLAEKISIERHAGQLVELYNSIMKKRGEK